MRKNPASESGLFNPRVLIAFTLFSVGALLAMFSFAATPSSGTLTDTSAPLSYTAGPFFVANPTVGSGPPKPLLPPLPEPDAHSYSNANADSNTKAQTNTPAASLAALL